MRSLLSYLLLLWFASAVVVRAEWEVALPGHEYRFPEDHGPHPAFRTEWWYFTGHLVGEGGREYGYQLTFFRHGIAENVPANASKWRVRDLHFAHMALTDVSAGTFQHWQRTGRGSFGEAGTGAGERLAWIDDWEVRWLGSGRFLLTGSADGVVIRLTATPEKPAVMHGENGVSQKAEGVGRASYYYSFTRMRTEGELSRNGRREAVTGESWFDHEWASNQLASNQTGWNWFSIRLDNGAELMLYQMRLEDGGIDPYSSGTWIEASGTSHHLARSDYQLTALRSWEVYPVEWRVEVPGQGIDLHVAPAMDRQELELGAVAYWEGLIQVTGTHAGKPVKGNGYLELTGFRRPLDPLRR